MIRSFTAIAAAAMLLAPHPGVLRAQDTTCRSTATGDLRFHQLASTVFSNTRTVRVLVPDDYDAPANASRRYPVMYLLDGQNVFDACLSDVSKREWQVDETVRRLIRARRLPPMIVVGIDHAGKDRANEYLPYRDPFGGPPGGPMPAGQQFPRFMAMEVMPLIDSLYRTLQGPMNTGLGGASYGGIATLHTLTAAPPVAGYALIESAPLWVGAAQVVRDADPLATMAQRVYIATGAKEIDGYAELQRTMNRLHHTLLGHFRAAGYDTSRVRLFIDPEGRHNEDSWARRFPAAMEFLWKGWRPPPPGTK